MILLNGKLTNCSTTLKRRRIGKLIDILKRDLYYYNWSNNSKRETMKDRHCFVVARGKRNSIMIQFLDSGQQEIVSRYSIRKTKIL